MIIQKHSVFTFDAKQRVNVVYLERCGALIIFSTPYQFFNWRIAKRIDFNRRIKPLHVLRRFSITFEAYCDVSGLEASKMKANISKYTELSSISIIFSQKFQPEDIPDDVIVSMLNNLEHRIEVINTSRHLVITHMVSDNKIIKSIITKDN